MAATKSLKKCELESKWFLIDATDCTLGRLAAYTANILRGKHKPTWTPNMDCGDHVIIINADKVALSGTKADKTKFFWHSLWTGSLKERTLGQMRSEKPEKLVTNAVKRMMGRSCVGEQTPEQTARVCGRGTQTRGPKSDRY